MRQLGRLGTFLHYAGLAGTVHWLYTIVPSLFSIILAGGAVFDGQPLSIVIAFALGGIAIGVIVAHFLVGIARHRRSPLAPLAKVAPDVREELLGIYARFGGLQRRLHSLQTDEGLEALHSDLLALQSESVQRIRTRLGEAAATRFLYQPEERLEWTWQGDHTQEASDRRNALLTSAHWRTLNLQKMVEFGSWLDAAPKAQDGPSERRRDLIRQCREMTAAFDGGDPHDYLERHPCFASVKKYLSPVYLDKFNAGGTHFVLSGSRIKLALISDLSAELDRLETEWDLDLDRG